MPKDVAQPQDKYVLRLPDGMRDRIKAAAELNGRSMNAEIVARLTEYPELVSAQGLASLLEHENKLLQERIAELETLNDIARKVIDDAAERTNVDENKVEFAEYLESFDRHLKNLKDEDNKLIEDQQKLIEQQSQAIEKMSENLRFSSGVLQSFTRAFLDAGEGDHDRLEEIIATFAKVSNEDDK